MKTMGMLDLGGGSTQITFMSPEVCKWWQYCLSSMVALVTDVCHILYYQYWYYYCCIITYCKLL